MISLNNKSLRYPYSVNLNTKFLLCVVFLILFFFLYQRYEQRPQHKQRQIHQQNNQQQHKKKVRYWPNYVEFLNSLKLDWVY